MSTALRHHFGQSSMRWAPGGASQTEFGRTSLPRSRARICPGGRRAGRRLRGLGHGRALARGVALAAMLVCAPALAQPTVSLGDLPPGTSVTIEYDVRVDEAKSGGEG